MCVIREKTKCPKFKPELICPNPLAERNGAAAARCQGMRRKQKEMFLRLGGADWLRSFLDTVGEAFDKKPEEVE